MKKILILSLISLFILTENLTAADVSGEALAKTETKEAVERKTTHEYDAQIVKTMEEGSLDDFKEIIDKHGTEIDWNALIDSYYGFTEVSNPPIVLAAHFSRLDITKELLENPVTAKKIDINAVGDKNQPAVLISAKNYMGINGSPNDLNNFKYLLDQGAKDDFKVNGEPFESYVSRNPNLKRNFWFSKPRISKFVASWGPERTTSKFEAPAGGYHYEEHNA